MAQQDKALLEQFKAQRDEFEGWLKDKREREDRRTRTRAITSLADVEPIHVYLEVERADDEIIAIPTRNLSYTRLLEIQQSVKLPTPEPMGVDKQGKPIYDYNDATYLAARDMAIAMRDYQTLFEWLDLAIAGDDLKAKIATFEKAFVSAETRQMFEELNRQLRKGVARVTSQADTFHSNGTPHQEDHGTQGTGE